MPLRQNEDFGTSTNGSKSEEYCFHCFKDGKFLDEGISLEQKIEKNVTLGIQMGMPEDMTRRMCETVLQQLNRWRKG